MRYRTNKKHKEPWQPGRKGSLCPPEISQRIAQELLEESVLAGDKRYAVHEGKAYCAQEHDAGEWHGYPVGWKEVDASIRLEWIRLKKVKRSQIQRFWSSHER